MGEVVRRSGDIIVNLERLVCRSDDGADALLILEDSK